MKRRPPIDARSQSAFSMIEVVVALGLVVFALLSVVGLFSVGMKSNQESYEQIQAANMASLLVTARRAVPDASTGGFAQFALPPLNQPYATGTSPVGLDGSTSTRTGTTYNLYYGVGTNALTGAHRANVYLLIWWPQGVPMPTNNPAAYYELSTQIALP